MTSPRYQRGRSLLEMFFLLILAGIIVLLALRLIPVFMDYRTLIGVAESVQEDRDYQDAPEEEVREGLRANIRINNLRGYDDEEVFEISRGDGNELIIDLDYEERVPFLFNIDLVASFERRVEP